MSQTRVSPESASVPRVRSAYPARGLAWALGFGVLAQGLVWDARGLGLNFFLLTVLALGGWWFALRGAHSRPASTGRLFLLAGAWAAVFVVRADAATRVVAFWAWLFTVTLALGTFFRGRPARLTGWDWARLLVAGGIALGLRPWPYLFHQSRALWARTRGRWLPLLLGWVLFLPIGFCFLGLLSSVDPILAHWVTEGISWPMVADLIGRGLVSLAFAWLWLAGLLYAWFSRPPSRATASAFPGQGILPWPAAAVILGGVLTLFVVFLALQARYLGGGDAALARFGLTYAEYARRGFGELVVVAVLSLGLLIALDAFTERSAPGYFVGMGAGMLGAVLLMLASAAYRLALYVRAFGWTTTRFLVAVFMAWLAVVLFAAARTWLQPARRLWPRVLLLPFFGFALSLVVFNPSMWVPRLNLQRAASPADFDLGYVLHHADLGPERWIALAEQYPHLPPELRTAVGARLACQMGLDDNGGPWELWWDDWRSWNWGLARARAAYARLKAQVLPAFPLRVMPADADIPPSHYRTLQVQIQGRWVWCAHLLP